MDFDIDEIIPNLYLSGKWGTDPKCLVAHNIECVLNVAGDITDINKGRVKLYDHLLIPVDDNKHQVEKLRNVLIMV